VMRNNSLGGSGGHGSNNHAKTKGGVPVGEHITDINAQWNLFLVDPAGFMNGRASKNQGPPEVVYLDHDGSRNDIGPNGGRNYIPDGRTTDKPIPISFSIAPQIVPVGGTVTIESTGATVK